MAEESPATCLYCDVETQQGLASRLLHTLAVRATLRKMTVEEAVVQLREKLLPPPTPSKKAPGPSLQTLHLAIQAAEDVKAKVFDPFFTTKDVGQGTGQGLTVVHSVVVERLPHPHRLQVLVFGLFVS